MGPGVAGAASRLGAPFGRRSATAATHVAAALGTASNDVVRQLEAGDQVRRRTIAGEVRTQRSATRGNSRSSWSTAACTTSRRAPTVFVIARLEGAPKATALMELQIRQYGGGCPRAAARRCTQQRWGPATLDSTSPAYINAVPGPRARGQRRDVASRCRRGLRGTALGHLTAFDDQSVPCHQVLVQRSAAGAGRAGGPLLQQARRGGHGTSRSRPGISAVGCSPSHPSRGCPARCRGLRPPRRAGRAADARRVREIGSSTLLGDDEGAVA